jgi:hypothetical protein
MKYIAFIVTAIVSWIALKAIASSPVLLAFQIQQPLWFVCMWLGVLWCVYLILVKHRHQSLNKRTAIWLAIWIGIFFSTYLDNLFSTAVMMLVTNVLIAAFIGRMLSNTNSLHKREDLLIFLWAYAPIKFITMIALLKGSALIKSSAPFVALFIMAIVVIVMRYAFNKSMKCTRDKP